MVNGPRVTRIANCLVVEGAARTPLTRHLGYQSALLPVGPEEGGLEIVGSVFDGGVQLVEPADRRAVG